MIFLFIKFTILGSYLGKCAFNSTGLLCNTGFCHFYPEELLYRADHSMDESINYKGYTYLHSAFSRTIHVALLHCINTQIKQTNN